MKEYIVYLDQSKKEKVFNGVIPRYEKNIMTIKLSDSISHNNNDYIKFDESYSIGNKLIFENNGIKIRKGVTKILVSCQIYVRWNATANKQYGIEIFKNETPITGLRLHKILGEPIACSVAPILVDVAENDIIKCQYFGENSTDLTGYTYLTVECIN